MTALARYFADELAFLRDLGGEFAAENPNLAPFLGRESTDPDVERLLEGFAFLTSRLRQRLDDELPELSHSLLRVLWPQYLRPFPSASTVEFSSAGPQVVVPRGAALQSRPVDGAPCRFQTCFDTAVRPLHVSELAQESRSGDSTIQLRISETAGGSLGGLDLRRLRLHLAAEREPQTPRLLLQWLRLHLESVAVLAPGIAATLPASAVELAGFGGGEHLLPYPTTAFDGFRHLGDYFGFPEKFLYVDVLGLERLHGLAASEFTLLLRFGRPLPERLRLSPQHVRLNCTPVVNLFTEDASPLAVDHRRTEYRVRPAPAVSGERVVYSIEEVVGWARGERNRTVYPPFESFRHAGQAGGRFYYARMKPSVAGRQPDVYLSFVTESGAAVVPPSETVTLSLTCTDGRRAAQVPVGGIDQMTASLSPHLAFRNISPVSAELPAPLDGDLLWQLVANLSRNYGSLADIDALRSLLGAYDIAAQTDQQARRELDLLLAGLEAVRTEPLDWLVRGIPVRGQRIRLTVAESKLGGEHEAHLLGCVLDTFFAAYAAVNTCHQLMLDGSETRAAFAWPVRFGARSPL